MPAENHVIESLRLWAYSRGTAERWNTRTAEHQNGGTPERRNTRKAGSQNAQKRGARRAPRSQKAAEDCESPARNEPD
jgi:hypothetical protein